MSGTAKEIVRDEIRAISAYHVASATGMIKLDAMENPYRLTETLRARIAKALADLEINRYPDPSAPRVQAALRRTMRIPEKSHVILGNGSDELIQIAITACARPGAVIMAPVPSFVMYRLYSLFAGVRFQEFSLAGDFSLDVEGFLSVMRVCKPSIVLLSYPNNPTGNRIPDEDIVRILRDAPGLVIVDEAYQPFAGGSFMDRLPEFPNLVVLRTLSKLGLAGIRLGYAVGDAQWIRELDKVRSPYNVNSLTQAVAEVVLDHFEELLSQAETIRSDRDKLIVEFNKIPRVVAYPSDANFVLMRVPSATQVFEAMMLRGVLVKNLHGAHPILDNCLRVTVGNKTENATMLRALEASVSAIQVESQAGLV